MPGCDQIAAQIDADGFHLAVHVFDSCQGMLTARIHLDDCGPANGPLRVVPGSHQLGILGDTDIEQRRTNCVPILARAGDVLYMRPLLLHASSAAEIPSRRRVIHLEFAGIALPAGLEWHSDTIE